MTAPPYLERGSALACTLIGLLLSALGLYLLVIAPSNDTAELYGRSVVNVQRLTIGETLTIAGAIFLAAAWRPRVGIALESQPGSSSAGLTARRREALLEDIARLEQRQAEGKLSYGGERTLREMREELARGTSEAP